MISTPPPATITVTTPARLHLGFLDLNGGLGRRFGSIGLAISGLRTRLTITRAAQTSVEGPDAERVARYLDVMQQRLALAGGHHVKVNETVPAHAGLGSGTQLALAVASGLRTLYRLPEDIHGDMAALQRGARSGIGIGAFGGGGLVVDAGRGAQTKLPPIVGRAFFPEHWRVVVLLDPPRQGVHGADEINAFARLAPMSASDAAHLCRLVLMKALPAVAEDDLVELRIGDHRAAGAPWRLLRADARRPALQQSRRCGGPPASRGARRMRDRAKLLGADRLCVRRVAGAGEPACRDRAPAFRPGSGHPRLRRAQSRRRMSERSSRRPGIV